MDKQPARTELFNAITEYCERNNEKKSAFATDCGINEKRLYRLMQGKDARLTELLAQRIGDKLGKSPLEIQLLLNNPYLEFKIKHRDDPTKPSHAVAGKICWNPKLEAWEYQIMLYNQQVKPPSYTHPVWETLRQQQFPQRPGSAPWESHQYFLFTLCADDL